MWEATFLQHYNSASDMFNLYDEDYERIKKLPNFNKKIFEEITGIKVR